MEEREYYKKQHADALIDLATEARKYDDSDREYRIAVSKMTELKTQLIDQTKELVEQQQKFTSYAEQSYKKVSNYFFMKNKNYKTT